MQVITNYAEHSSDTWHLHVRMLDADGMGIAVWITYDDPSAMPNPDNEDEYPVNASIMMVLL